MDTKICKKCGRELPISQFYKRKRNKDGLQIYCKECEKQYRKQYYIENKEVLAEKKKQYYTENKETIAERNKRWYADNKEVMAEYQKQYRQKNKKAIAEKMKQYMKQWYAENKKAIAEQNKRWRTENKERRKQYMKQWRTTLKGYCISIRNNNIQNDRKYGRIGDELPSNYPTIEDYMELLQMPDFYDGKQYHFTEMGLDRIDNSKPHTLDNIVPCTTQHNREKHLIPFDVFKNKFLT